MLELLVGVLGLCLGSFFNVLIARLPLGESVVSPGSRCPKCGHVLAWYENIPVLAWLALRGKCKKCKAPISPRYIAVELLTGALFVLAYVRFGLSPALIAALTLITFLIPLAFIDAEHWILPFELTLPGIAAGLGLNLWMGSEAFQISVTGAVLAFCLFRGIEYFGWLAFRKEAMGGGDKYLAALICSFLGPRAILGLFLLSAVQGAVVGILGLLFSGRAGPAVEPSGDEPQPLTMTWEFARPGLSLGKRLLLLPYSIFIQPIPDEPKDLQGEEVEWQPGPTNLPFGPWLALAALELMLVGPWLSTQVPVIGWVFDFNAL